MSGKSHTRVREWTPGFREALRLAWKPLAAYGLFVVSAFIAFMAAVLSDSWGGSDNGKIACVLGAGLVGVGVGQVVALKRLKTAPALILSCVLIGASFAILAASELTDSSPALEWILPAIAFFVMAVPCGIASLQHRYELLAAFWPAVGWIGAVIVVLERNQRLASWDVDKAKVWTPTTIGILTGFILTLMLYLASKQTMRVELWQALSGATERRISKRTNLATVPRKNMVPLLLLGLALTGVVALLAPFLWRTGPGKEGSGQGEPGRSAGQRTRAEDRRRRARPHAAADGGGLARGAQAPVAAASLPRVLPTAQARAPPAAPAPTDGADAAERADRQPLGVRPHRRRGRRRRHPARRLGRGAGGAHPRKPARRYGTVAEALLEPLDRAAAIYTTTRYGFVVESGAAARMQIAAEAVARQLRGGIGFGKRLRNGWRALT